MTVSLLKKKTGKNRITETNLVQVVFQLVKLNRLGSAFLWMPKENLSVSNALEELEKLSKDERIPEKFEKRIWMDGVRPSQLTNLCINQERKLVE